MRPSLTELFLVRFFAASEVALAPRAHDVRDALLQLHLARAHVLADLLELRIQRDERLAIGEEGVQCREGVFPRRDLVDGLHLGLDRLVRHLEELLPVLDHRLGHLLGVRVFRELAALLRREELDALLLELLLHLAQLVAERLEVRVRDEVLGVGEEGVDRLDLIVDEVELVLAEDLAVHLLLRVLHEQGAIRERALMIHSRLHSDAGGAVTRSYECSSWGLTRVTRSRENSLRRIAPCGNAY